MPPKKRSAEAAKPRSAAPKELLPFVHRSQIPLVPCSITDGWRCFDAFRSQRANPRSYLSLLPGDMARYYFDELYFTAQHRLTEHRVPDPHGPRPITSVSHSQIVAIRRGKCYCAITFDKGDRMRRYPDRVSIIVAGTNPAVEPDTFALQLPSEFFAVPFDDRTNIIAVSAIDPIHDEDELEFMVTSTYSHTAARVSLRGDLLQVFRGVKLSCMPESTSTPVIHKMPRAFHNKILKLQFRGFTTQVASATARLIDTKAMATSVAASDRMVLDRNRDPSRALLVVSDSMAIDCDPRLLEIYGHRMNCLDEWSSTHRMLEAGLHCSANGGHLIMANRKTVFIVSTHDFTVVSRFEVAGGYAREACLIDEYNLICFGFDGIGLNMPHVFVTRWSLK